MMKNKVIVKAVAFLATGLVMGTSYADEKCAVFNFAPSTLNGEASVLELAGSNGKSVVLTDKKQKASRKVVNGEYDYLVEVGEHTIVLNQWKKEEYIVHNKNISRGRQISNPPQPVQRMFHLNAEAGHYYRIGYSEQNGVYIEKDETQPLTCDTAPLIEANKNKKFVTTEGLPAELEQQLMLTMNKVAHHQKNGKTNVFPIKENQYFGIVFDTNKGNSNGFAVKMIIPNSIASTLDIKPGDIVTKLGEEKELANNGENPYGLLNQYVKSIPYSKKLAFTVLRNGQKKTVTAKHVPVLVPEAFYQLAAADGKNNVYGQAKLPKQVQFEFDQLLLALAEHYKSTGLALDKVVVVERKANKPQTTDFSLTFDLASADETKEYLLEIGKEGKMQDSLTRIVAERMGAVIHSRNQYTNKDG
ncbi:hypothetical protein tinsulaeT_22160 [Thalassotalea insulae]|uniref:PDZ domain-containing protein n=1 Tax=Thalassotalea insulae TaxID=2056778 RepID=A0ABQ6GXG3_9GAMM|nr:hypothetical protein [Thalassotalea insulae]GLX78876.1 hypothetical protein tinsulaeT_22160 [Thalassotalea insulae]